jgi:hypothetical protein
MQLVIEAKGDVPLTVVLEPSGMEYTLAPGDHFVFQLTGETEPLPIEIVHSETTLTFSEGSARARLWDSKGTELSLIG